MNDTPIRTLRVPNDLWEAAQARAKERGETSQMYSSEPSSAT